MSADQHLKDLFLKTLDSLSSKFLNRLVNILTGTPSEKVKNDQNLSAQICNFLSSKEGKIILIDSNSKQKIAAINNFYTPIINSIIAVPKLQNHICNLDCYENNYSCQETLIHVFDIYQVVDHPTLKNNSLVEVLVKQI